MFKSFERSSEINHINNDREISYIYIGYSGTLNDKGNVKKPPLQGVPIPLSRDTWGIQGTNSVLICGLLRFCFDVSSCLNILLYGFQAERNCLPLNI